MAENWDKKKIWKEVRPENTLPGEISQQKPGKQEESEPLRVLEEQNT